MGLLIIVNQNSAITLQCDQFFKSLYADVLHSFCMEFKMESLTAQCMVENRPYTRWMQYLREGYTVCVACQPPAMNNHSRCCQGDGNLAER